MHVREISPHFLGRADGGNFVSYAAPNAFDQAKACWFYKVQSTLITPPILFYKVVT